MSVTLAVILSIGSMVLGIALWSGEGKTLRSYIGAGLLMLGAIGFVVLVFAANTIEHNAVNASVQQLTGSHNTVILDGEKSDVTMYNMTIDGVPVTVVCRYVNTLDELPFCKTLQPWVAPTAKAAQ